MNAVIENILERRSIRSYKNQDVKKEDLELIMESATYAPSGMNNQSWIFTVITNKKKLKDFSSIVRDHFRKIAIKEDTSLSVVFNKKMAENDNFSFFHNAPVLVIVSNCVDYMNAVPDCAVAIENILLSATSLGLGSCWVNQLSWLCEEEKIRDILKNYGVPDNYVVCGSVAIGYADNIPDASERKKNNIYWID